MLAHYQPDLVPPVFSFEVVEQTPQGTLPGQTFQQDHHVHKVAKVV